MAVAEPAYISATKALGEFPPADPQKYDGYDAWLDRAMENHLKGAKLTRSFGGFERVAQQTQRAELSSTYEQKKQTAPSSGLSRLLGKG